MKKTMIVLAVAFALTACGGNSGQTPTTVDSTVVPGPDSSQILPALTDSAKADTAKVLSVE